MNSFATEPTLRTPVTVEQLKTNRGKVCHELLRSLPKWFGIEASIQQYVADVENLTTFVAKQKSRILGFVSIKIHNAWTGEIHVMAVSPDNHRRGVGRALIAAAEDHLRSIGRCFLTVKTVSPSLRNPEYEKTHRFYFALRFRPVEEFKTLWGEANTCLLMIKTL